MPVPEQPLAVMLYKRDGLDISLVAYPSGVCLEVIAGIPRVLVFSYKIDSLANIAKNLERAQLLFDTEQN